MLAAQRDRYLPLRVIREQLDGAGARRAGRRMPAGTARPARTALARAVLARCPRTARLRTVRLRRSRHCTVLARPGRAGAVLPAPSRPHGPSWATARLTRARAVRALRARRGRRGRPRAVRAAGGPGRSGYYGAEALTVARIAARLAEYGLEGRHLRPYRATADREVGLLAQLVPPLAGNGRARRARAGAGDRARAGGAVCPVARRRWSGRVCGRSLGAMTVPGTGVCARRRDGCGARVPCR